MNDEYPKWMNHPHEQPAVLSDDYEIGQKPPLGYSAPPGRPRMFPPVQVMDRTQEAYYAAQGYRVGPSQRPAFVPRPVMPLVSQGSPAAQPEIDLGEWPQWLFRDGRQALAKTPQEAAEIEAAWSAEDRQKTTVHGSTPKGAGLARRWELIREAKALGIPADGKWTIERLQRAIEEAGREKQTEAA
jgi:hypothetical protein